MKITVLGSGGFGYPLVFCDCKYCHEARILKGKNIRKRASILINDEMIVDLTPDCQTSINMYEKDMSKTKYLLQTHSHSDHFDINLFTTLDYKYSTKRNSELTLICSTRCLNDIHQKVSTFDQMNLLDELYLNKTNLKIKTINHGETTQVDNYEIKAIHTTHDEKLGAQLYLIKHQNKSLLYATDTPPITQTALNELVGEKIDCIILDESFGTNNYTYSHLNIQAFHEYVSSLKQLDALNENCKVFATHITHEGNPLHDELEKILNKFGYSASYDGLEINI